MKEYLFCECKGIIRGMGRGEKDMICTKCGARLMETDQFCPKCGAKVVKAIKEKRCTECGEILRDGVKFCPGCGRAVGGKSSRPVVSDETLDIPIEAIERNILTETAAEIKKERRTESGSRKQASVKEAPARRTTSGNPKERGRAATGEVAGGTQTRRAADAVPVRKSAGTGSDFEEIRPKKRSFVPAPPPRKKQPVYREEEWEEDDWDEEEDWDDDDWDDEEDGEGIDVITIMTVVVGCVLLIVVAFLGYQLLRQYLPKNYDRAAEEQEEQQQEQEQQEGQESQETLDQEEETSDSREQAGVSGGISELMIVSNVNVRDQPSTTDTNVLKVAKAGETYVCNGYTEDGAWYEIVLEDGTVGYVFHEYISVE